MRPEHLYPEKWLSHAADVENILPGPEITFIVSTEGETIVPKRHTLFQQLISGLLLEFKWFSRKSQGSLARLFPRS